MSPEPPRIRWQNQPTLDSSPNHPRDQTPPAPDASARARLEANTPLLDQIGRDLTKLAREGRLQPVFGRREELIQLQRILLRKQKSNPVLVGAPGVGKTALVEGLAILIAKGEAGRELRDCRIVEITPSALISGTTYRGDFERRMQVLLAEATRARDLILFIDEIHTLIRAGAVEGGALDAANILKPALARGDIRCIGASTSDEYDKLIQSDSAFERRFEPLILEEPTESEAIEILKAALPSYENHHGLVIQPDAAETAVKLSSQHILDRRLPDKAFDLLDAACTLVRLPDERPSQLNQSVVDSAAVSEALAQRLHVPAEKLGADLRTKLSGLEAHLNQRIIGQPLAMNRVCNALMNAYTGLNEPNRPRYVFAFFGASGVGKTATAKALAEFIFSSADALIRLDMSEYKEPHTISRLLGAPPGYLGYDDEGTFATRLRRQPFSAVLLDEFEKAHPQILDAFLHIFDEGRFTDARGRRVDARHSVFILTSNLFTLEEIDSPTEYERHALTLRQSLCTLLRPEFVNRIDEIILYRALGHDDLIAIARLEIENLNSRLSRHEVTVSPTDEALDWIANEAHDSNGGARAVIRMVSKQIAEPISSKLIEGPISGSTTFEVLVNDNHLILRGR